MASRWRRAGGELAFKLRDPCVLEQDVFLQPGNLLSLLDYQLGKLIIGRPGHEIQFPPTAPMLRDDTPSRNLTSYHEPS